MKRINLINRRKSLGLTQKQVAEQANVSRSHYSEIESGIKDPSLSIMIRIANVLKCDLNIFYAHVVA